MQRESSQLKIQLKKLPVAALKFKLGGEAVNESKSLPPDKVRVHLLMVFPLLRFRRFFSAIPLLPPPLPSPLLSVSLVPSLILYVRALVLWLVIFLSANEFHHHDAAALAPSLDVRRSFLYFFNLKTERLHGGQLSGLKTPQLCYGTVSLRSFLSFQAVNPRSLTLTFDDTTFLRIKRRNEREELYFRINYGVNRDSQIDVFADIILSSTIPSLF